VIETNENLRQQLCSALLEASRTRQFGPYFNLVDSAIRSGAIQEDFILNNCGEFMDVSFQRWHKAKKAAIVFLRVSVPRGLHKDINKVMGRQLIQHELRRIENLPVVDFIQVCAKALTLNGLLDSACTTGDAPLVSELCDMGADINQPNQRGRSPLIQAIIKRHVDVIRVLLEKGAVVSKAAVDLAKFFNLESSETVLLLEKALEEQVQKAARKVAAVTVLGIGTFRDSLFRRPGNASQSLPLGVIEDIAKLVCQAKPK